MKRYISSVELVEQHIVGVGALFTTGLVYSVRLLPILLVCIIFHVHPILNCFLLLIITFFQKKIKNKINLKNAMVYNFIYRNYHVLPSTSIPQSF